MKTISCFSYKGGAGRSTLALNIIPFLAEELGASAEHPLIVIDMDIDSCGMTYLFDLADKTNDQYKHCHVQELFNVTSNAFRESQIREIKRHLPAVGHFFGLADDNAVLCIPANPGASFIGANNYDGESTRFQSFIELCEADGVCGILLDSAVGNQMTANWSNSEATHIMCCMRPTKQFREGTKRFFDKFDTNYSDKDILVIPNVVPTDPLDLVDNGTTRHYPDYAKTEIRKSFEDNIATNKNRYILDMLEGDCFGVPKIDRFMWQEGVLNNHRSNLNSLERQALEQYKKIATIIKNS